MSRSGQPPDLKKYMDKQLQIKLNASRMIVGYTSGRMVKLSWLKEFFSRCPDNDPIEVFEQHTRAYLIYLVGSTIFSTTTRNKAPVTYLSLFENFVRCGQYAWGSAALSFLYRALGNASLRTQRTISGCLTLLQCWSYFHINVGQPKLNLDMVMNDRFPFVLRWKGEQSGPTANRDVVFYQKALDSLKPCDVEWLPYRNMDNMVIPNHIKSTLILGRSKTMLICFDKAERHLPNRCLRQYGMLQSITDDVEQWERKSRGVDGGVDLSGKMESELTEWMDRQLHIVNGDEGVDESVYMDWYMRNRECCIFLCLADLQLLRCYSSMILPSQDFVHLKNYQTFEMK
ncbi:hypothetical protein KIW84_031529 [Lathyrus oleraceus]|uniref:Aminotransferase-like plant mobile domain-containing protein n=1 Tax=Pisum sativum TaxID=3888 RepID=A0A9D5B0Y3_PEA|nr:hypothetical protein KIW84_031529 [Pisum sativum]